MKTEADLFRYFKQICKRMGVGIYKVHAESATGFPDLFLCYGGRIILVELKSPAKTGRLSERQQVIHRRLREKGVKIYVSDSQDSAVEIIGILTNK